MRWYAAQADGFSPRQRWRMVGRCQGLRLSFIRPQNCFSLRCTNGGRAQQQHVRAQQQHMRAG